jgi:hypothetical protein
MLKMYTDEQVEEFMSRDIAKAIYSILIPMEPACVQIQNENAELIDKVARSTWRNFLDECRKK